MCPFFTISALFSCVYQEFSVLLHDFLVKELTDGYIFTKNTMLDDARYERECVGRAGGFVIGDI